MTPVEPKPEVGDGPQDKPTPDDEAESREVFMQWERNQGEHGEHRVPRSDR